MRKKYLSALLFGALLFASAGTFTSCKDYDDDIDNLQGQITDVKNAVTELQKKIADLKYVSNVASEGNGLKITWNDGTSTTINNVINEDMPEIPTPGDIITFDAETGEIIVNGKGSGYFAAKDSETAETKLPYVNENGALVLIDKDGNELVTNITVAPVSAIKNADGSYTITILCNGEKQEVVVPSAASTLSAIEMVGYTEQVTIGGISNPKVDGFYTMNGGYVAYSAYRVSAGNPMKDWKGNKPKLASGDLTAAYDTKGLVARIAPTSVDAKELELSVINSKNETNNFVTVRLTDYDGKVSRAASANSMYNVHFDCVVKGQNAGGAAGWDNIYGTQSTPSTGTATTSNNVLFALKSASGLVSKFNIAFSRVQQNINVGAAQIKGGAISTPANIGTSTAAATAIEVGTTYSVSLVNDEYVYDSYLSFNESQAQDWGVVYNQADAPMQFSVTKMPDSNTPAPLTITVNYATLEGTCSTKTVYVMPQTNLNGVQLCSLISHDIVAYNASNLNQNSVSAPLSAMISDLGNSKYITWKDDVNLTTTETSGVSIVTDDANQTPIADAYTVKFLKADGNVTTNASEAASIRVTFQNTAPIDLTKQYIAIVKFASNKTNKYFNDVVNTVNFPVEFSIPAFTDLLQKDMNVFDEEGKVASAFMLERLADVSAGGEATSTYKFQSAFTNLAANVKKGFSFTFELDAATNIVGSKKSSNLALIAASSYNSTATTSLAINTETLAKGAAITLLNTERANAYGKELIVKITSPKWCGVYAYDATSFKIKLLSPIKEGKFEATGGAIKVAATGLTTVTAEQVFGLTAKDVKYDLFKTSIKKADGTYNGKGWAREDVTNVEFSADGTKVTIQNPAGATPGVPADAVVDSATGAIVTPSSIQLRASGNPGDRDKLTITVTDMWGYKITKTVDVVVE